MSNAGTNSGWATGLCLNCSRPLEFQLSEAGTVVTCPHCLQLTVLNLPGSQLQSQPGSIPPLISPQEIITTTGNDVAGYTIEAYLGIVRGIVVRSPDILKGVLGGLKSIVGGNIETYAKVCEEPRRQAFDRMVQHARELNANAVIAVRYDATEFSPGITEVLTY